MYGRATACAKERDEMLGDAVLIGISILTSVYLLAALLWPERF